MLYLQPTGDLSGSYGAAGDLDFMSSWTLIGRGTKDTGRAVLTAEFRLKMGDQPPSAVGREIDTLIPDGENHKQTAQELERPCLARRSTVVEAPCAKDL